MARWRPLTIAIAVLSGTGCIYISPQDVDDKVATIDEDGDGSIYKVDDCDDNNPDRYPLAVEIAYNAVDEDCNGEDLVDVDRDGFPGITEADWNLLEGSDVTYPTVAHPDEADCNDNDAEINPGETQDWYDGINNNCVDDPDYDDYDQDGDGQVLPEYGELSSLPATDCDDSPTTGPDIYYGSTVNPDVPYDGIDNNCDGANDFDADGDGYIPFYWPDPTEEGAVCTPPDDLDDCVSSEIATRAAFGLFCQRYFTNDSADLQGCYDHFVSAGVAVAPSIDEWFTDCADRADQIPVAGAAFGPEDVHPHAIDANYDGVDLDCAANDEFDVDGDGFIADGDLAAHDAYVEFYDYDFVVTGGECDDSTDLVHPGLLETLDDGVDQDCDGDGDTTPWRDAGFTWTNPRPPVVGMDSRGFVVTTAADYTDSTSFYRDLTGVLLSLDAAGSEVPPLTNNWFNQSTTPSPFRVVDSTSDTQLTYPVVEYLNPTSGYLVVRGYAWDGAAYKSGQEYEIHSPIDVGIDSTYVDVDVQLDDSSGITWIGGCGPLTFTGLAVGFTTSISGTTLSVLKSKVGGICGGADSDDEQCIQWSDYEVPVTCFIEEPDAGSCTNLDDPGCSADLTLCTGTGCRTYEIRAYSSTASCPVCTGNDDIVVPAEQPYATRQWTNVNQSEDWLVADDPSGDLDLLDGTNEYLLDFGAPVQPGTAVDGLSDTYIAAVIADQTGDGVDDVLLSWGDPAVSVDSVVIPVIIDGATYEPTGASVYVSADRVLLAVSGVADAGATHDTVAWMFLGPR